MIYTIDLLITIVEYMPLHDIMHLSICTTNVHSIIKYVPWKILILRDYLYYVQTDAYAEYQRLRRLEITNKHKLMVDIINHLITTGHTSTKALYCEVSYLDKCSTKIIIDVKNGKLSFDVVTPPFTCKMIDNRLHIQGQLALFFFVHIATQFLSKKHVMDVMQYNIDVFITHSQHPLLYRLLYNEKYNRYYDLIFAVHNNTIEYVEVSDDKIIVPLSIYQCYTDYIHKLLNNLSSKRILIII